MERHENKDEYDGVSVQNKRTYITWSPGQAGIGVVVGVGVGSGGVTEDEAEIETDGDGDDCGEGSGEGTALVEIDPDGVDEGVVRGGRLRAENPINVRVECL